MKQYLYQVKGILDPASKEALLDALREIPMVDNATLEQEENLFLSLTCPAALSEQDRGDVETLADAVLQKYQLQLELPALSKTYVTTPAPKQGRMIPLAAAVGAMITAVVLAVLCTFAVMTMNNKTRADQTLLPNEMQTQPDQFGTLDILDKLFAQVSPFEVDDEAVIQSVLNGYISATGDLYAQYYTQEEFDALYAEQNGEMCGIGVQVVNGQIKINGVETQVIVISNVFESSPASEAGLMIGDYIVGVGLGEDAVLVQNIGYSAALDRMSGVEDTACEFTVYRAKKEQTETDAYEVLEFSIIRKKITAPSVKAEVCDTDETVGIVRIYEFDNTTPTQLRIAVDELKAKGCTCFVFDLRGNPGGQLTSIVDVLTYFLNEEDVILTAKDKYNRVETITVGSPAKNGKLNSGSGTLTAEDIGRYKNLKFAILVNEYTASAAELFTANVRDYALGLIVGTKTYGKGSMQSTLPLAPYGYEGGLKLTTKFYFPPCGEGYDGIGITPHEVVELSEEALQYHFNLLPHDKDNQLQAAISLLKP